MSEFPSASLPIPTRRTRDFTFGVDADVDAIVGAPEPLPALYETFSQFGRFDEPSPKTETFRMDDDDIVFQVDEADLIQGPTLAELNANDDTLLDDLKMLDDLNVLEGLLAADEPPYYLQLGESVASASEASPSPVAQSSLPRYPPPQPPRAPAPLTRLCSSAPTHLTFDQIWQRREPRKHLLSTGSLAEAGSTSSLSTGGVLSPAAHDLSQEEDSDEDSDRYEDFSSDDSDGEEGHESKSHRKKLVQKGERYFWQYNIQAKGPKGQRLVMRKKLEDPHVLNEVTDPVFSPSCSLRGIKHSGKARKGDGNDLTPNPRKLYMIGKELDCLGKIINEMTPVSELPFNARPKTRKEKNKLASRACRLKKKAQHEANKLKLYGLQQEHKQLMNGISHMKQAILNKIVEANEDQTEFKSQVDNVTNTATKIRIAGYSSEFVNRILDKVKSGVHDGGLSEINA